MENPVFYDGSRLLSLKDINGKTPEIFISETNRSAGKTTYFGRLCVNAWKRGKGKFCLVYRYNYELDDIADKFYKDISRLFFQNSVMKSKRRANGIFHELEIDGESCGYAISLNSSDQIKKYSHLFSDVRRMLYDEFQSETNHYCTQEVKKLISVHTSIARGNGKHVRYVPIYMLSNPVTILNPYYVELGISTRLRDDTKYLRGDGFVLERGFVQSASAAQLESGFNRAFAQNSYIAYSAQSAYLNDNSAFVDKPRGRGRYLVTLKYNSKLYGVREYAEDGIIYCDDSADITYPDKICVTTADHNTNYVMLRRNAIFISNLRWYFERGCFRFKNLQCKEAILKALSY